MGGWDRPATPKRRAETEMLIRRRDLLKRLHRSSSTLGELVEATDYSRRTVIRAINELERAGFVEREDGEIEATTAGRIAYDRFVELLEDLDEMLLVGAVVDPLPTDVEISDRMIDGCAVFLADSPDTDRSIDRVHDELRAATDYRALVPTAPTPRRMKLLYEHVVTDENPVELLVTAEVFESLREAFPRRMTTMARTDQFSVTVTDVPPFGVELFEQPKGTSRTAKTRVRLVVFEENGDVHGVLVNESAGASQWAEHTIRELREAGVDRTDRLIGDSENRSDGTDVNE